VTHPPARAPVSPGQRSVWDFPRPPAIEQWHEHVVLRLGDVVVADTTEAWCVLETSHPPTYYLPPSAFAEGTLRPAPGSSYCEWKGRATYLDIVAGDAVAERAAWAYPDPTSGFISLQDHVSLYPAAMGSVTVDGVEVQPQPGGFYGGWITPRVAGPFKGSPGTLDW